MKLRKLIQENFSDNEMPPYIYTYPTKKAYQPFTDWKKACESWLQVTGPLAIYIHIPFCDMKCSFCDLFTVTKEPKDVMQRYVQALIQEIKIMKPYLQGDKLTVQSVYFGGGTPSLLSIEQLQSIIAELKATFSIGEGIEYSIEGAPNSFSKEKFADLKTLGINRVSIGIQTFNEEELRAMGRFYGADLGFTIAQQAMQSGIRNVNLDLIYGIPGQDFDKWKKNLLTAIEIGPTTLTTYPLVVRNRTSYGKQMLKGIREDWIASRSKYHWYDFTHNTLTSHEYQQHTLVTYAKEAGGCSHEAIEFGGAATLAFGAGARKYAPDFHYVDEDYVARKPNKITMMNYMQAIEQGSLIVRSAAKLHRKQQVLRYVILRLLASGISKQTFLNRFQQPIEESFENLFQALEAEGIVENTLEQIKLTLKGRRYSSHVGHFIAQQFGGADDPVV